MPTYDYVCTGCGHEMEVMHPVHGHGPSACPVCGSPMKKTFAPLAVHFKGSGWARKERASGGPARGAEKPGGSAGTSGSASESGSGGQSGSPTTPAAKDRD